MCAAMSSEIQGSRPTRLLIVEDELSIIFALREFFATAGFVVDTAMTVAECEQLLADNDYAVLITDVHLTPNRRKEGLQLVKRAHEKRPAVRAIVLTAYGSPDLEEEARQSGADAFFAKPMALPVLASTVERFVGGQSGA
jgi:DNA-binding NtrC family response regulator